MKKTFTIALAALSAGLFAQSSILLKHIDNNNAVIAPNSILYKATSPNHTTHFDVDITNTSSSTISYNVKRYDMKLNTGAVAYFCFGGSCYDNSTFVSPNALSLNAGQSASQVAGTYNILTADLDEGATVDTSIVRYTFINTANATDSVQFIVYYNIAEPTVGIKENSKFMNTLAFYPNPAKGMTSLQINSANAAVSSILLYNSIGDVVYKKDVQLSEGKNKIDLNLEHLPSGVYFASVKNGEATISKKLIIN